MVAFLVYCLWCALASDLVDAVLDHGPASACDKIHDKMVHWRSDLSQVDPQLLLECFKFHEPQFWWLLRELSLEAAWRVFNRVMVAL